MAPGAVPIGIVAINPNPAGVVLSGTGVLLHVDFLTVFLIQPGGRCPVVGGRWSAVGSRAGSIPKAGFPR